MMQMLRINGWPAWLFHSIPGGLGRFPTALGAIGVLFLISGGIRPVWDTVRDARNGHDLEDTF